MAKYSKEQRDRAVDLYVRYERCAADVIHELGYPSRGMLPVWYRERLEEERTGRQSTRGKRYRRYTDEQKRAAVDHYLGHGRRLKRTMRALGYPKSHELLTAWIDELAPGRRKLRHGPVPEELKRKAVAAVASGRLKSREAAAELGVEASVVRNWKRQMLAGSKETHVTKTPGEKPSTAGEGKTGAEPSTPAAMPPAAAGPRDAAGLADAVAALEKRLAETRARLDGLDADVERQRREKRELDIEIAIRKGVIELLGKEPGAVPENLTNREKAILVKQTSEKLGVTAGRLLPMVGIARSTYHYQIKAMDRPDKDAWLLPLVEEAFENSKRRYGYKRIHLELKGMGVRVSAKRVMRLTARHGLAPLFKSAKRYSSYKGELTKAPKNLVNRDFHAERPNMLWVTDLTEFSIPAGKAYLSPVIDCYDGLPVAWTIGTSPNAALANGMPADACSTLGDGEKPIIHSDRGVGQRHARRRVLHARGRGEADHPFRPRLPLPVARVDPHLQGAWSDAFDEREGMQSGQRGRGGVLRPSQAGVLPQEELPGRDDRRVHRDARRVHGLVPRQAHQDRIRHEHHGQTHPARARRLKPSGTLTNDHTDNEVQQNVTTPF